MPLEDDFCDIAKKARLGRGVTTEDLSKQSGVSVNDLAELERGSRLPQGREIEALASALGLRPRPLVDIVLKGWRPQRHPALEGLETVLGDIGGDEVKGYVLYDQKTRDGILVDTAYNARRMLQVIDERGVTVTGVCLTH